MNLGYILRCCGVGLYATVGADAVEVRETHTSSEINDRGTPGEENGGSEVAATVLTTTDITDDKLQLNRPSTLRGRRPPDNITKSDMGIQQSGAGAGISATPGAGSTTRPGRSTPSGIGALQSNSRDRQTITIGGIDPMTAVEEESPTTMQIATTGDEAETAHRPNVASQRPDGVFIDWNHRDLVILEFTRPMDSDLQSFRRADSEKEEKYERLKSKLVQVLPFSWTVKIVTFSVGARDTIDQERWEQALTTVGVPKDTHGKIARRAIIDALRGLETLTQARSALYKHLPRAGVVVQQIAAPRVLLRSAIS